MRSMAYDRHPVPTRGALAIVTNVGRGAVDAVAAKDERGLSVRRRRVVLTPDAGVKFRGNKLPRSDGGKRASAHRREHVISRKAIAQGMSDCLRCPVCSYAHSTTPL